jgi:hypothetical protein
VNLLPQPESEPPIPARVHQEVQRILDGVAKRLFLERLDREKTERKQTDG